MTTYQGFIMPPCHKKNLLLIIIYLATHTYNKITRSPFNKVGQNSLRSCWFLVFIVKIYDNREYLKKICNSKSYHFFCGHIAFAFNMASIVADRIRYVI